LFRFAQVIPDAPSSSTKAIPAVPRAAFIAARLFAIGTRRPFSKSLTVERETEALAVYADEAAHWDVLHARYLTKRVNHSVAYSENGVNTNQAESFFSRLRRAEIGMHHHIAGPYLQSYSSEIAWREDNWRRSNGELYLAMADAALKHPVSRQWKGYWRRQSALRR
jgi:ISXO2-like transposase domain